MNIKKPLICFINIEQYDKVLYTNITAIIATTKINKNNQFITEKYKFAD